MLPSIILSKDQPVQEEQVLITAINDETSKSSSLKIGGKKYQVYVIEDAMPPVSFPASDEYTPLPSTVELSRIVANVITSLNSSYFKQISYKKYPFSDAETTRTRASSRNGPDT